MSYDFRVSTPCEVAIDFCFVVRVGDHDRFCTRLARLSALSTAFGARIFESISVVRIFME